MNITNNDGSQGILSPENQNYSNEATLQKVSDIPEVAGKTTAPQPANPVDDKSAAQTIANTLQNTPAQPQNNVVPPVNPSTPVTSKAASSDPYIKAAEKVMEKDQNDPYQEEEDHEDVQIKYLHDRFGKDIKKS